MKQVKKVLAFFMALAMLVSVFSGTGMQVQADTSQVVYFDNSVSSWSQVYAYVWGDGLTTKAIKGNKVEGTSCYKMEIPTSYSKILFKNTSGTKSWDLKTANTTIPTDGKNCFKAKTKSNKSTGSWSVFTETTKVPSVTTAVPSVTTAVPTATASVNTETTTFYYDNSKTNWANVYAYVWADNVKAAVYSGTMATDKVYKYEVPTNYKKVLFKNINSTSSWDLKTDDSLIGENGQIFRTYSGSNKTSGYWENYQTVTPRPETMINFKYDNSDTNWSNVYAYVWGNGYTAAVFAGTYVGDRKYSFSISDKYANVLFKNTDGTTSWVHQTGDAILAEGNGKIFVPDSGADKTSGKWENETKEFRITGITFDPVSPQNVGAHIRMTAQTENETTGYRYPCNRYYTVTNLNTGASTEILGPGSSGGLAGWDPTVAGTYKISVTITDMDNRTATFDTTYEIKGTTPTPTPGKEITVKYDNSKTNWADVYAYVWCEDDKSIPANVVGKTSVSGNIYTFKVSSNYRNILFKNTDTTTNWDKQTADAGVPADDGYIFRTYTGDNKTAGYWDTMEETPAPFNNVTFNYDNSKTAYKEAFVYAWADGVKAVTYSGKKSGTTYTFTIDKKYTKVLFKNVNSTTSWDKQTADAGAPVEGYTFVPASGAHKTTGEWKDLRPVENRTVKFDNSSVNWNNVYAYIWTEGDSSVVARVISATNVQGSKYTFEIPSNYKNVLFKNTQSNWDKQTLDAFVPATNNMIYKTTGVDATGKVTGSFVEETVTKTVRRALTYGVGSEDGSSQRHYNDTKTSANMYKSFTYDGVAMESVVSQTDLSIAEFKKFVKDTFAATTDNDVSYISIACHGGSDGSICLGTGWTSMTGAQFRALMDECIKGEVVVLLDCCYSGKIIANSNTAANGPEAVSEDFSSNFMKSFNAVETNSGELASDRFHVICASRPNESSWGTAYDVELAVKYWEAGLGWDEINDCRMKTMAADANGDKKVSMAELFAYSEPKIIAAKPMQHPIVYPENDSMIVGGRY